MELKSHVISYHLVKATHCVDSLDGLPDSASIINARQTPYSPVKYISSSLFLVGFPLNHTLFGSTDSLILNPRQCMGPLLLGNPKEKL